VKGLVASTTASRATRAAPTGIRIARSACRATASIVKLPALVAFSVAFLADV
jgi:hypothetical protein